MPQAPIIIGANGDQQEFDPTLDVLITGRKQLLAHTWAIAGEILVPVGDSNFINPMFAAVPTGYTAAITRITYKINSGTSVTFDLLVNGTATATGLSAATTVATSTQSITIQDLDEVRPVVTAVSGTPNNLAITIAIELTEA